MQRDSNKRFMQACVLWVLKGWGRAGCRRASAVTFMCQTLSLFGPKVGDHIRRRGEGGSNIAQLNMLAAEVDAHVNVA